MSCLRVRTTSGDVDADALGPTLSHEHLHTRFGVPAGDADCDFADEDATVADFAALPAAGFAAVVEASTYDMRPDLAAIARIARRTGLRVVKTTGWFRSPTADPLVEDLAAEQLAARLIADLETGFAAAPARAGAIGEVGIAGAAATGAEARILDATAAAALRTGARVLVHTDDWPNALLVVGELEKRGLSPDSVVLCHVRCGDPLSELVAVAAAGAVLSFDQLGHPRRDRVDSVARRLIELDEAGVRGRLAVSTDLGRRSRLRVHGGLGCARPLELLDDALRRAGSQLRAATIAAGVPRLLALRARAAP